MADTATPATGPTRGSGDRGNRNRGRGGGNRRGRGGSGGGGGDSSTDSPRPNDNEPRRGGPGGRGGNRGRGGRGGHRGGQGQTQSQPADTVGTPTPAATAAVPNTDGEAKDPPSDAETEDICFICANPIQYTSIAQCNHMTCHICALRMRALYKTKQCPHCRTNSDYVIFTTNAVKTFEEYTPSDIAASDEALGIKYEGKIIRADTLILLRYNCPEPSCEVACLGWPDLHRHVRNTHHLFLCDLCSRYKKVFTHEHTLFTSQALRKHERHGDDVPGTEDQSGFKGHPECDFCRKRFYGDDELYAHCKEKHERCFICDRDTSRRPQYFMNWEALEQHFIAEHYRCPETECLEKKFIVFASEMDLKAHLIEEHPNSLSKGALKDMRKVDMTAFPDSHGHGGSGGPSRGRSGRMQRDYRRDPQAPEPPPPDGPMRRDEIAYQRTLAVQSAQTTVPQRMFGGQLSRPAENAPAPAASRPPQAAAPTTAAPVARQPVRQQQQDAFPPLGSLSLSSPPATSSAPVVRAAPAPAPAPSPRPIVPASVSTSTSQKHEAVLARALRLLNNDASKMEKFKKYISNYNADQLSGKDLIEAFWVLFDVRAADLATLLRELSELFEREDKKRALLEAWNEWKSINEDYPPMAGGTSTAPAGTSTSSARVLKLKSATNRNLHAGASPWSSVTSSTISRGAGSLANINGGAVTAAGKGKAPVTPWAAAARNQSGSSLASGGGRGVGVARATGPVNTMEFPSLPKAGPKYPPVPRKNEGVAPASVWGGGSGSGGGVIGPGDYVADDGDADLVRTKGKGKKKQTIIQWG